MKIPVTLLLRIWTRDEDARACLSKTITMPTLPTVGMYVSEDWNTDTNFFDGEEFQVESIQWVLSLNRFVVELSLHDISHWRDTMEKLEELTTSLANCGWHVVRDPGPR